MSVMILDFQEIANIRAASLHLRRHLIHVPTDDDFILGALYHAHVANHRAYEAAYRTEPTLIDERTTFEQLQRIPARIPKEWEKQTSDYKEWMRMLYRSLASLCYNTIDNAGKNYLDEQWANMLDGLNHAILLHLAELDC